MKKKVLVIGINGMAGHVAFRFLQKTQSYQVYGIARNIEATDYIFNLDVSEKIGLGEILEKHQFDYVINCVGILNQDAESNPSKAIWFNSYFPHFLEELTKDTLSKIIHISTDCVFDGKHGNYSETGTKNGLGFYAQSKALGEIDNFKDLTIRTSIIGPELNTEGIGLFNWFMQQRGEINGYSSAIWSGVTTLELAKAIDFAIKNPLNGLVHLTNGVPINKFDLLQLFKEIWDRKSLSIIAFECKIIDKSLKKSERFNYQVAGYKEMLIEQHKWIEEFATLYQY
jgi:dTDP-4-dehydrorhamnose reductase